MSTEKARTAVTLLDRAAMARRAAIASGAPEILQGERLELAAALGELYVALDALTAAPDAQRARADVAAALARVHIASDPASWPLR